MNVAIFVIVKQLAIIIPVLNEETTIDRTLHRLKETLTNKNIPVYIVDGGSQDDTQNIVLAFSYLDINLIKSPSSGRALQMHLGAKEANAGILYFLHADSLPPKGFDQKIIETVTNEAKAGCFQLKFDSKHWLLCLSGWFTRFQQSVFRGGDQSLFITRDLYEAIGGFDTSLPIMEDIEIIDRIKRYSIFKILDEKITTSARKYRENGYLRLQIIFGIIHLLWHLGLKPARVRLFYDRYIR